MRTHLIAAWVILHGIAATSGLCQTMSPETVKQCLEAAVVVVASADKFAGTRSGSGFLWRETTQVITAWHVVAGADRIYVCTTDGAKTTQRRAIVTGLYINADLVCLTLPDGPLRKDGTGLKRPLQLQSKEYEFHNPLFACGAPLGIIRSDFTRVYLRPNTERTTPLGQIIDEKTGRQIDELGFPSTSLPVLNLDGGLLPGHSGCAVVNVAGALVGIGNGGLAEGRKWAIPSENLELLAPFESAWDKKSWDQVEKLYAHEEATEKTLVPLIARIGSTKLEGVAPMDVEFRDQSQGNPTEWSWDFGDGKLAGVKNPIHSYTKHAYSYNPGGACWERKPFTISLTVRNARGEEHTTVLVDAVDLKPRQVRIHIQVQPAVLSKTVYVQALPPNSAGCGKIQLATVSTPRGHYYVGQEVGLQASPVARVQESGRSVAYLFDGWSGWEIEDRRVLPGNGHHWGRLRISDMMPEGGITIMANYRRQSP